MLFFFFYRYVELTFLTVAGPVPPSDMLFLTVKGSRVDRHSSIIRLFREDLGKCLTGEGKRGDGISFWEIPVCWPDVLYGCFAFTMYTLFIFFFYIYIFTIIVYIITLVLSARTGIYCLYDNGSPI